MSQRFAEFTDDELAGLHQVLRQAGGSPMVAGIEQEIFDERHLRLESASVSELIQKGIVCGTCADDGERSCSCNELLSC